MRHLGVARPTPHRRVGGTGDQGTAMVELALILPLLLLLIVGVVRFGVAFNAKIEMSGAAREAARYMVAHQSAPDLAAARLAAKNASPGLALTDAEITIVNTSGGSACATTAPYGAIRVTITRSYSLEAPLLPVSYSVGVTGIGDMQC
jgi:Flp pilus assembly protein TadG